MSFLTLLTISVMFKTKATLSCFVMFLGLLKVAFLFWYLLIIVDKCILLHPGSVTNMPYFTQKIMESQESIL